MRTIMSIGVVQRLAFFVDLLYPPRCGGCGAVGVGLWCAACKALVHPFSPSDQTIVVQLTAPWEAQSLAISSAAAYATPLQQAIHALKYDGVPQLALPLAQLMTESGIRANAGADVLVPVPLHPTRERERGYNQSTLLAKELGAALQLPVDQRGLHRVRHTDQQAHLGAVERKLNVQGAFVASADHVAGKRIILVDDVLTTGATLGECAAALLRGGALHVDAITLARAG